MNPKDLLKRIEKLESELKALKDTRNVPRDFERALKHRMKVLTGSGPAGTFNDIETTRNLTGNAQNIDVLDVPDGYIPILYNNEVRKVGYWND